MGPASRRCVLDARFEYDLGKDREEEKGEETEEEPDEKDLSSVSVDHHEMNANRRCYEHVIGVKQWLASPDHVEMVLFEDASIRMIVDPVLKMAEAFTPSLPQPCMCRHAIISPTVVKYRVFVPLQIRLLPSIMTN
jgi:hypothetical protein